MFSSDKNIDAIYRLVELVKHNIGLQKEYLKLDITEKTVKLITGLLLFVVLSIMALAVLVFLSFAVAFALAKSLGTPAAFCIVAAFYAILFLILALFKKSLVEKPLVRFITSLIID